MEPDVGDGHNVYTNGEGLLFSGCDHELVESPGISLEAD